MIPDEFLAHHGILGMHWRKRKSSKSQSSVVVKNGKYYTQKGKEISADTATKITLKKKKLSEMTNDDLAKLTKRLQLEKQYKDLKKTDMSAGQKFVQDILVNSAKQAATNFVSSSMTKGLDTVLKASTKR